MAGIKAKVAVAKVIAKLNERLAQDEADQDKNKQLEVEYRDALEKWKVNLVKKFGKDLVVDNINTRYGYVEIRYTIPEGTKFDPEPNREHQRTLSHWEIEEIKNAISILKMTDDEFVSASTFSSISKYL